MNQSRVPHNNLSFHRCIPPSYHNFIKWRSSTLDPVLWPGRLRNFVTMVGPWHQRAPFWSEGTSSFSPLTFWWNKTQDSYRMDLILNRIPYKKTRMLRKNMCALIWSKKYPCISKYQVSLVFHPSPFNYQTSDPYKNCIHKSCIHNWGIFGLKPPDFTRPDLDLSFDKTKVTF